MIIEIKFKSDITKSKAILKLKDCLYTQENDVNYIYAIKRINDGGFDESEEMKMRASSSGAGNQPDVSMTSSWTTSLPVRYKEHHQLSDLVMIQTNLPLCCDPQSDIIKIQNCPDVISKYDCEYIERNYKHMLGEEQAYDLKIRKYKSN